MEQKTVYPGKQLQTLKQIYNLKVEEIAEKANLSPHTVQNVLKGKSSVVLRNVIAVADALGADVVITLKARESHIREHVKALLSEVSAIQ